MALVKPCSIIARVMPGGVLTTTSVVTGVSGEACAVDTAPMASSAAAIILMRIVILLLNLSETMRLPRINKCAILQINLPFLQNREAHEF
jgi:hypothetical protein